jgi:hypothetical protein
VVNNHEELQAKAGEEFDDAKAQAQAQLDSAKQVSTAVALIIDLP